jgi:hypothetical protein
MSLVYSTGIEELDTTGTLLAMAFESVTETSAEATV